MGTSNVAPTRKNFSSGESTPIVGTRCVFSGVFARVSLHGRRKLAITGDRHEPDMIGSKGVDHVKHALRRTICQRFGRAALSFHGVPGRLDVQQRGSRSSACRGGRRHARSAYSTYPSLLTYPSHSAYLFLLVFL